MEKMDNLKQVNSLGLGIILLLVWSCLLPHALVATTVYKDIAINVALPLVAETTHGYASYRITLTNTSTTAAHEVALTLPYKNYSYSRYNHIRSISRTVVVGPSSTVVVALAQPALQLAGEDLRVAIDGMEQAPIPVPSSRHGRNNYYDSHQRFILISRAVGEDFRRHADKIFGKKKKSSSYSRRTRGNYYIQSDAPVTSWHKNWLAYSRYDGIVISANDIETAPAGVHSALLDYVACGGALLVMGSWNPPSHWQPASITPVNYASRVAEDGYLSRYFIGFGECFITSEQQVAHLSRKHLHMIQESWISSVHAWRKRNSIADANKKFPVIDDLRVPVRSLFVLILLFAIAIGPVNFIVLSKKKKRMWMLWTVPAISLVTCIAVFLYALLVEGWRATIRTEVITILDERTHRAVSVGWTAFYAPLTPGDGAHFSYDTEISPQVKRYSSASSARNVDWSYGQHLSSGWVAARVPAHFRIRKAEVRRERLQVNRVSGGMEIVNGLGGKIASLWLCDRYGNLYTANDIAAGSRISLFRVRGERISRTHKDLRSIYSYSWQNGIRNMGTNPSRYLKPRTYVAILPSAPFVEEALHKVKYRKYKNIVYGYMKD